MPKIVLNELDKLKKDSKLRNRVMEVIREINKNKEYIYILDEYSNDINDINDDLILNCIKDPNNLTLVTNDEMLHFKAWSKNIKCEFYKNSIPFLVESQKYTGFIDKSKNDQLINNCFYWEEGKLIYHKNSGDKYITYDNEVWKVKPRTPYQNAALELILDDTIDLITIQSEAGFGKTYLALAAALKLIFEEHKYKKLIIIKPNIDVGNNELGFLPGNIQEKIWPYFLPIYDLLLKLHELRPANKLWKTKDDENILNDRKCEFAPLNFMRGRNISDALVIIDETQNYSKSDMRVLLSRMGDNTKCICLGDIKQIDNIYLTEDNNGLNWLVKLCKNQKNYGHIVLKGNKSRGPIADLVRNIGL